MAESLALYSMGSRAAMTSLKRLVEDYERRLILDALARARGNQRRAAAELGLPPHHPQREDAPAGPAGVRSPGGERDRLAHGRSTARWS